jgi:hypothetical protein
VKRSEKALTFTPRLIEVFLDWFVYGRSPKSELRVRPVVSVALVVTIAVTAGIVITHT